MLVHRRNSTEPGGQLIVRLRPFSQFITMFDKQGRRTTFQDVDFVFFNGDEMVGRRDTDTAGASIDDA